MQNHIETHALQSRLQPKNLMLCIRDEIGGNPINGQLLPSQTNVLELKPRKKHPTFIKDVKSALITARCCDEFDL
jgi:hypothetical protein